MKYLGVLLLCSVATFAHADDANKRTKLNELMTLMNSSSMVEAAHSQMEVMLQNMSDQMGVTAEEQPIFDEYYSRMMLLMREEMNWEKMKEPLSAIYAKHFSEQEIEDMLAFYRTETGQKTIEKLPLIMQDSMVLSQQMMSRVLPKLQQLSEQLQADLAAQREKKSQ